MTASPYHELQVTRIREETADARSLTLAIPTALEEAFRYSAGQFLTFRLPVEEERLVRCYSLASAPELESEHKVTIKRVEGGRASNWMNDSVQVGDTLEVMKPAGRFCLQDRPTPLVLFAGGSGITPVISLVKTALASTQRRVRLVYANRDAESTIFRAELTELADRHADRFRLIERFDSRDGFVDAAAVRGNAGEDLGADFYVCGPGPFMTIVEETLLGAGLPSDQFFIERFEYAAEGSPIGVTPAGATADASGAEGTSFEISLDGETLDVPLGPGETVVEAARRAGMDPPTSCEEGYCACCMARLEEGAGAMKANDVLDPSQLEEGWVLTCQFVPTSARGRIRYPD
ncbi:MAG: 2Fe-2S iron-sulfur cluster-binding protein [Myxococcota bacterium]